MTPLEIQSTLKHKGITQRAIAYKLGISEVSVHDVIHKRRISDRVMRGIAESLGEDVRLVFPEYYLRPPKRKNSKVTPLEKLN